jgi:hypothetical protein
MKVRPRPSLPLELAGRLHWRAPCETALIPGRREQPGLCWSPVWGTSCFRVVLLLWTWSSGCQRGQRWEVQWLLTDCLKDRTILLQ